jgi:hypothetical protein
MIASGFHMNCALARVWFSRLASAAFLIALGSPLHAQTLIVSYFGYNPYPATTGPGTGISGLGFFNASAFPTLAQIGSTVQGIGTAEGDSCLAGGTNQIFVADNSNVIRTYTLNSAMTGVTAGAVPFTITPPALFTTTSFASLSLNSTGPTLYAAGGSGGIYAINALTGNQIPGSPVALTVSSVTRQVHDVAYSPLTNTVYATYPGGDTVYAFDGTTLAAKPAANITLPTTAVNPNTGATSTVSYAQEGLVVDAAGNLFVSNFGTIKTLAQPGVLEFVNATGTPIPFFSTVFDHPLGLAVGPGDGKIYVANFGDNSGTNTGGVLQISPSGSYPTYVVAATLNTNAPAGDNPKYLQFVQNCTPSTPPTGTIEVCKMSSTVNPVPANGVFNFTVSGSAFSTSTNPLIVPVGECSGPIQVTPPASTITELPVLGVGVSDISAFGYTSPIAAETSFLESSNLQARTATVMVVSPATPGDTSTETVVTFTNQQFPPAILKVCKVAGPGVNVNTPFTFTLTPPATTVTVGAGPLNEGGFCVVVPGTYQVGAAVSISEAVPGGYAAPTITVNGKNAPSAGCSPTPYCVVATIAPGINEVSFTNSCSGANGVACPALPLPGQNSFSGLDIVNYSLVSQTAASGSQWFVTYRADLVNAGATGFGPVMARLTSLDPAGVQVLGEGALEFPAAPANGQVGSRNTFTVLTDLSSPLDFSKLRWTFQSTRSVPPRR